MTNAHRFALSALLVLGSAVLAGLLVVATTPRYAGAKVPPAAELPWPSAVKPVDRRPPLALLYVDSHCAHCSRAAIVLDSVATARRLRTVIATRDSSGALLRAIGTRAVPTLVLFHADGSRQLVVGFTRDARYRAVLAAFEQR